MAMQEHRIDGIDVVTTGASFEEMKKALADDLNSAVTMHKPGSLFRTRQGGRWETLKDGGLRSLDKPKSANPVPAKPAGFRNQRR